MICIKNALGSVTLMMSTFFLSDKFGSLQQIRQGVAKKKDFQLHYARPHCSVALYLHSGPSEAGQRRGTKNQDVTVKLKLELIFIKS